MKKFLLILSILTGLCLAGLALFVATYDINKLKPILTEKLSEAVGNPVTIGHLTLRLGLGVSLGIDDFLISENNVPVLEASQVWGSIKLIPLLQKKIQVGTIQLINPKLRLQKDLNQIIQVQGISIKSKPDDTNTSNTSSTENTSKSTAIDSLDFSIHRIEIRNGEISYQDLSASGPMRVDLKKLDVTLTNVSPTGTIGFDIATAAFSDAQNVRAKGSLSDALSEKRTLTHFSSEINLNEMDFKQAFEDIPVLKTASLRSDIKGVARITAEKVVVNHMGRLELNGSALLEGGHIHLDSLQDPFTDIAIYIVATPSTITLEKFSSNLLGGSITLKASTSDYSSNPNTNLDLRLENLSVKDALRAANQAVRLDGQLSLNFKGTAVGKEWDDISKTLNGAGDFILKKGVLLDANPIKEMLNKLNFIPGFEETVNKQIPEILKAKIDAPNTPILKPLAHDFKIENGAVYLNGFELPTELFTLQSDMAVKLSGHASGRGKFIFGQELGDHLKKGSAELSMLSNQKGALSIPIRFEAGNEGFLIFPELGDLGLNQIISKGRELLSGLFSQ